jgi:putative ABC transport system permease protein
MWREKSISLYVPTGAGDDRNLRLIVRTDGDPRALASMIRAEAASIDPQLRFEAVPFEEVLSLWTLPSRVAAIAGSLLGAIALAIAAVGIYGVMSYSIAQRKREIAIRIALGATRQDVRTLLLTDGGRMLAIGLLAGAIGAVVLMRAITSVLHGAVGADPLALVAAVIVLTVTAAAACYFPVRTASELNPLQALRAD